MNRKQHRAYALSCGVTPETYEAMNPKMTANELATEIRKLGCAVVIFQPTDMEGFGYQKMSLDDRLSSIAERLEERMVELGWDIIGDMLGRNDEDE